MRRVVTMCAVALTATSVASAERVTFYGDVLPILQENCQVCHRPGGTNMGGMVAPMAFTSYEETRPWAKSIAKQVANKTMPPWHAAPQHAGVFENERTMSQAEIDTIVAWVDQGTARGSVGDAPPAKEWPSDSGWAIGEPDLKVSMPDPYFVEDDVEDIYRTFYSTITDDMLPEERFIKAVEFHPGSAVVHHIIAMPLGGIAPGNDPTVYPDGVGTPLKPGTEVSWQMHYHKEPGEGTGVWDQSEAGIRFYENNDQVTHVINGESLGRFDFRIPPGSDDYSIQQEFTFAADSEIISLMPHMHLRGKSAKYEAFYPDGTSEVVLDVPRYDFNWQTAYRFKEFKKMPAGTKMVFTSAWDNSTNNAANPDPNATVRFGEPTTDEMSFGFMSYIDETGTTKSMFGNRDADFTLMDVVRMFDENGDDMLQRDEAPGQLKRYFDQMDFNKDGAISMQEAEIAQNFRDAQEKQSTSGD